MRREVRWERMFPDELEAAIEECPVAYLPYGLCEPHGPQNAVGMDAIRAHDLQITAYALDRLRSLEGIHLYGPTNPEERGAVTAFNYLDIHAHDLSTIVDGHGIAIRAGHHCAPPLMRTLNVPATARASYYIYNQLQEIDALLDGLRDAARVFGFSTNTATNPTKNPPADPNPPPTPEGQRRTP